MKELGDIVAVVTKYTGVKKVVDVVSEALDVDCKCDVRQEKLNYVGKKIMNGIRKNS